jgi:hypothetical protein
MLTYVVLCITAYLVIEILRAPSSADATGYLLVSGLMPLPVYMIGGSVNAGVFPIDVCLLAYLVAHGRSAFDYAIERRALSTGVVVLFGLSILATCSGVFNYFFVDPDPLKFYAFTVVKFWEYALLGMVLIASRPDAAQLRRICAIVLAGILVYEILHALHISGIVPLSGEEYYGARAVDFDSKTMVADVYKTVPFSDRTGWFLTASRAVVGGTASINVWLSLMVFEAYRGAIKMVAAATAILSVFSVLATTSRSDIAGLAVAAIVFFWYAPPRRWKSYVCASIIVVVLSAAGLTFFLPAAEGATAMERVSELWNPKLLATGAYAERASDRATLLSYLPEHPSKLLIGVGPGNFRWYRAHRITYNSYGHNSYLHWTGELGIGGFLLLLAWCLTVCLYTKNRLRSQPGICRLAARTCLAVVISRMVAAWGGESLFGIDGMGYYSLFFVGVVYLLASSASGATGFNFHARHNKFENVNAIVTEGVTICPR